MTSVPVHVVIVDDDPPVRRALARLLSAVGFKPIDDVSLFPDKYFVIYGRR